MGVATNGARAAELYRAARRPGHCRPADRPRRPAGRAALRVGLTVFARDRGRVFTANLLGSDLVPKVVGAQAIRVWLELSDAWQFDAGGAVVALLPCPVPERLGNGVP
jgi:hypothetical protein